MKGKIIEQARYFNYLGNNISHCERKEVNKVNKFQRMCGTISKTLKVKAQLSTQIKFCKVMYGSDNGSLNRSDKRKMKCDF